MSRRVVALVLLLALGGGAVVAGARGGPDRFDHLKHARLFPTCTTCHAGAVDPAATLLPAPATSCAACHDGSTERRVDWTPRPGPRPSNLAFDHAKHPKVAECRSCHADAAAPWMTVRAAQPATCFTCHGEHGTDHLAQADTLCAACHTPLAGTRPELLAAMVAQFPRPASHHADGFGTGGGHGRLAKEGDRSCATCHAQEYCTQCHVDGATTPAITRLGADPRALALPIAFRAPASHAKETFERGHGALARQHPEQCTTCHTQQSCTSCHSVVPQAGVRFVAAAAVAGQGAQIVRAPPASHGAPNWNAAHGPLASARPQNCAGCHARTQCLECHRADAASGERGGLHPRGFLASHPAAAYARSTTCADCHNTQSFCQDCHVQSGVVASGRLRGGFHDGRRSFLFGHGQAARQSLESCVSCHAERDCLSCHSSVRGRGFDPHGPGFNGDLLKRKNPGLCAACHATGTI